MRWFFLIAAGSLTDVVELKICKGTFFIEDELLRNITDFGLRLSFRRGKRNQDEESKSKRKAH
jgi:hypothetical protein